MKNTTLTSMILSLLSFIAFTFVIAFPVQAQKASLLDENGNPAGFQTLELGAQAPDFTLPGIDDRNYTLEDSDHADVLMVLFTSNHCPTSHSIEKRLQKLIEDYSDRSFAIVAINPNHPDGLMIDELGFGEFSDSFEDMKPYEPEHTVTSHDARNALEDMFAGREVAVPVTRPHGCSTKWREKRVKNVSIMESWAKLPVSIEKIDTSGVAALRANPTNHYRLFNVWATWCKPCVEEFPDLLAISRQFDMRGFDRAHTHFR